MLNALMKAANSLRRLWWRLSKPTTVGVRVIAINDNNQVLLVRHRYDELFYLPGGAVDSGEELTAAAKRELREETGIKSTDELRFFGAYQSTQEYKRDIIFVFLCKYSGSPQTSDIEIREILEAPIESLPPKVSPATRRRLAEYEAGNIGAEVKW